MAYVDYAKNFFFFFEDIIGLSGAVDVLIG